MNCIGSKMAGGGRLKEIHVVRGGNRAGDSECAAPVIAGTDMKESNHKATEEARRVSALIDVVEEPEHFGRIVPPFFSADT